MFEKRAPKTRLYFLAAAALALLFLLLTYLAVTGKTQTMDELLAGKIYALRSPGLTTLMEAVTYTGNWQTIVVLCLLALAKDYLSLEKEDGRLAYREYFTVPHISLYLSLSAILANTCKAVVKNLVARPRPDLIWQLLPEKGYSFPSGHAFTAMAVYGLLAYWLWRRGRKGPAVLSALLPFLIAFTRVYLGVHYPADVIAGLAGGGAILLWCVGILTGKDLPEEQGE